MKIVKTLINKYLKTTLRPHLERILIETIKSYIKIYNRKLPHTKLKKLMITPK